MKDILILIYNRMWELPLPYSESEVPAGFRVTEDRGKITEADAVIFHLPSLYNELGDAELDKPDNQIWIGWSMENPIHYPMFEEPEISELFDLKMTYRQSADIFAPYIYPETGRLLRQQPVDKNSGNPVVMFISAFLNYSGRLDYAAELSKHIGIDSYGRFMRNRVIENDRGPETKQELISKYKFTIAFENSVAEDYVTEKFYEPLAMGSIPIYMGAPNIAQYSPGANCYINVNDYKSPAELAEYLKYLDANDSEYQKYLAWKNEPFLTEFSELLNRSSAPLIQRICTAIKRIQKS